MARISQYQAHGINIEKLAVNPWLGMEAREQENDQESWSSLMTLCCHKRKGSEGGQVVNYLNAIVIKRGGTTGVHLHIAYSRIL